MPRFELPPSLLRLRWCAVVGFACLAATPLRGSAATGAGSGSRSGRGDGGSPVRIELRPEVEVSQPQVTLGDVAILDTRDLPTLERLVALPLGSVPWVGSAHLERAALARWIGARTGLGPTQIEWGGAEASAVRMATQDVSGGDVARRASEALRAAVSREGLRAEIEERETPADVAVAAGQLALRVRGIARAALLAPRVTVWVEAWVDGRFARTVPVAFGLQAFGPGYVASRDGKPGEKLDASAVEVQEVRWSGRNVLPAASGSLDEMRLRFPVAAGAVLTPAHLEPAPLVARGTSATLHVRQGLVQLESRVEVMQDGWAGQVVLVRVPGARGAIRARVTGPETLEEQ